MDPFVSQSLEEIHFWSIIMKEHALFLSLGFSSDDQELKTARVLIEACRIKSNIHPLLADHVFREADRFLHIIDRFEESLTSTT